MWVALNPTIRVGLLIGVISGITWGLNDVFSNLYATASAPQLGLLGMILFSLSLSACQDGISGSILLSYWMKQGKARAHAVEMKPWLWLILLSALFAGPLGMTAGILGIAYAGPVYAGVVTSCYPIVALVLSIFLLKEAANRWKLLGVCLSVFAVMMIATEGAASHIQAFAMGMGFAVVAMMGWGMESVIFAYVNRRVVLPASWILSMRQLAAALYAILLIAVLMVMKGLPIHFLQYIWRGVGIFYLLACVVTAMLSYLFYYMTIKRIGASMGTVFNATFVFWAAVVSILIGLATLSPLFWVWTVLLIVGITLSCISQRA